MNPRRPARGVTIWLLVWFGEQAWIDGMDGEDIDDAMARARWNWPDAGAIDFLSAVPFGHG